MKSRAVLAVLAGVVVLSGCGESSPPPVDGPGPVVSSVPAVAVFGGTYTYPDGLALRVGAPVFKEPVRNGDGSLVDPSDTLDHYTVEVTLSNGTSERFDPSGVSLSASGGGRAGKWYATGDEPSASLPVGGSVSFSMEFAVAGLDGLVVEVVPAWDREPVVFEPAASTAA